MSQRVGTICYATNSGLGILAKEFIDNKIIDDILVVRHNILENYDSVWYPNSIVANDITNIEIVREFIKKIDILFLFETGHFKNIDQIARDLGVKVVLMPMYEWSPYPINADLYLAPSLIDRDYCDTFYPSSKLEIINVPAHSKIKWKLRTHAKKFFHNAGNGSFFDRNGTESLLASIKHIKSPIKLVIRSQNLNISDINDERVEITNKNLSFDELWEQVDSFVFVERFNGLSMPLQEAYASGCLVIAGDRYPVNTWLPQKPLVRPTHYSSVSFQSHIGVKSACYDSIDIAKKIDDFYDTDIKEYSLMGLEWSKINSWDILGPRYKKLLGEL